MRGRPRDSGRARAKAQAHAKRSYPCTCGKIVHGNGGRAAHRAMHERRNDNHRIMARARLTDRYGLHCLNPETCNPDKGREGCVCDCVGCRAMGSR